MCSPLSGSVRRRSADSVTRGRRSVNRRTSIAWVVVAAATGPAARLSVYSRWTVPEPSRERPWQAPSPSRRSIPTTGTTRPGCPGDRPAARRRISR
ncbi:hypothetical protein MILUP08_44431 [Micromonospora lupini str. Lupac 08]|uniref:Uncharacterized protein n=1 Tax=Micromonospora lupini str. Lupac 08 TaxID=1150864 RepID=I0L6V9_9ACTN|nr:hypothetical protein MILUP08_44431 [Micromonospora lupini str. Lupac 08]